MKAARFFRSSVLCLTLVLISSIAVHGQKNNTVKAEGYAGASYNGLTDNEFMTRWWVLGPVKLKDLGAHPFEKQQKEAFDHEAFTSVAVNPKKEIPCITIGDTAYEWQAVTSKTGTVDFIRILGGLNYTVAYAVAEIKMDAPAKIMIGLGSDDGVKVFLNGTLVHSSWLGRPTVADDDLFMIDLKKGSNQLLVKVQNMESGWSFTMRRLGKDIMSQLMITAAAAGNLDNVKLMAENGASLEARDEYGLTAYQQAAVSGRDKVMDYLKQKGARTDNPMPAFEKLVDGIFRSAQSGITPAVSVLVSQDGKILYRKAFGYADAGNKIEATPDTKFRIGSVTKQFIAVSVLKLQEEGKLNVDDKLSKYLPGFPRGDEVTIRHLLTHTSGIHSYTDRPLFLKYLGMPITTAALVDTIKAYPYDFNPGDKFLYNNSGFFLLGAIIEKISGKSLAAYLQETLFGSLGMANTGIYTADAVLSNEACGYTYSNDTLLKALNWDMTWAGGAGALYSTANDLYTWNEAVFSGKVLSPESLKAAHTPAVLNDGKQTGYGYGWSLEELRGQNCISHGGGLHGFVTYLERVPDSKVNVIVLCNSTPPPKGINPTTNSRLITQYLLWDQMAKQSSFESGLDVDINTLKSYTGRYNYSQGAVLTVTLEGSQLYAQMTGQPNFPIFPSSDNKFSWKVVDAQAEFVKDEKGNVTHLIHRQGGQTINAKKLPDEQPVQVSPALFDAYTGRYDVGGKFSFTVAKNGGYLMLQVPNMPAYRLLPASETEFFTLEANARIIFKSVENGKANAVILMIDGAGQPGTRTGD